MEGEYLSYEKLKIWDKAVHWAVQVIDLVETIETGRKHFRLIEQLESAATSVSMNIAEGKGRWSKKEFRQYLYISRGSLYETITLLKIFKEKSWISEDKYLEIRKSGLEINKMINSLLYKLNQELGR